MNVADKILNIIDRAIQPSAKPTTPAPTVTCGATPTSGSARRDAELGAGKARPVKPPPPPQTSAGKLCDQRGVEHGRITVEQSSHRPDIIHPVCGQITPPFILGQLRQTGVQIISPEQLKKLRELSARFDDLQKKTTEVVPTSERIHALLDADSKLAGQPNYIGLSVESARAKAVQELSAVKRQLSEVTSAGIAICENILPPIRDALAKRHEEILRAEIESAAKLGLPFWPSVLCSTLEKTAAQFHRLDFAGLISTNPRQLLLGLVGLLMAESEAGK